MLKEDAFLQTVAIAKGLYIVWRASYKNRSIVRHLVTKHHPHYVRVWNPQSKIDGYAFAIVSSATSRLCES